MSRTFGSDPELLVTKKDGSPISAIGVVAGDIDNRIKKKGHEFYYDNVLAECAVKPGATKAQVLKNFRECLTLYAKIVGDHKLVPQASCEFPISELDHPDARKVGCAPDMCAYEMVQKEPPKSAITDGSLRSGGGHIHVGSDILVSDGAEPVLMIYLMDLLLGVPSLWIDTDPTSLRRRSIYGQAGRYRTKPYGLEYRSLSNFWLMSPEHVSFVYDVSMLALDVLESGEGWNLWTFDMDKFLEAENASDAWTCHAYDPALIQYGINESNQEMVSDHYALAKSLMPTDLRTRLEDLCRPVELDKFYDNWGIK